MKFVVKFQIWSLLLFFMFQPALLRAQTSEAADFPKLRGGGILELSDRTLGEEVEVAYQLTPEMGLVAGFGFLS